MTGLGDVVGLLKAAGEDTRLRLIALLAEGEQSVKDLTEILGQSQPRVSRHLKLLADAGLVSREAEGAWAYYRLTDSGAAAELAAWLVLQLDPSDADRVRDKARLEWIRSARQSEAAAYFATVARSWDAQRSLHVPEAAVEAAILEAVGRRQVDLLIDIGTGTGRMLELLADRYRRGVGIDSSREMLGVARAKLAAAGVTHAQVRLGDILDPDAQLGPADLIVIHQVLHYFDDPGRVLANAAAMLSAGGEILVVDFAPHNLEFLRESYAHRRLGLSTAQIAGWARNAGLEVEALKEFPHHDSEEGLTVCLWRIGRAASNRRPQE